MTKNIQNILKFIPPTNSEIVERARGSHKLSGRFTVDLKKVLKNYNNGR